MLDIAAATEALKPHYAQGGATNTVIRYENNKWVLRTKDGSRVLGTHDTQAKAMAQERAIEAAKHSLGRVQKNGV